MVKHLIWDPACQSIVTYCGRFYHRSDTVLTQDWQVVTCKVCIRAMRSRSIQFDEQKRAETHQTFIQHLENISGSGS